MTAAHASLHAASQAVSLCARLLAQGYPLEAVVFAQHALRAGTVTACSPPAGRLHLLIARALHVLGLHAAAASAQCDGRWILALHGIEDEAGPPGPVRRGEESRVN